MPVNPNNHQLDYETRRFGRSQRGHRMNQFERAIARQVLAKLPPRSRVVDIPSGLGRFMDIVVEQGHHYVGMDIDFDSVHYASKRLDTRWPVLQASILELPLVSDAADFVIAIRMFHHFQLGQIEVALKEISRVAPEALVTFYNRLSWRIQRRRFSPRIRRREWQGGESWHDRTYSLKEMEVTAGRAGLRVKERFHLPGFLTTNQFLWLERVQ
jgi:cyclopropane fatty-acyl-phospholipid synthase-like methyltransferase